MSALISHSFIHIITIVIVTPVAKVYIPPREKPLQAICIYRKFYKLSFFAFVMFVGIFHQLFQKVLLKLLEDAKYSMAIDNVFKNLINSFNNTKKFFLIALIV